jgi:predicted N-acetyltransferase YhbS
VKIQPETAEDIEPIRTITTAAFRDVAYSSHTEAAILGALRNAGALTLSLVAPTYSRIDFSHRTSGVAPSSPRIRSALLPAGEQR